MVADKPARAMQMMRGDGKPVIQFVAQASTKALKAALEAIKRTR
jgi:hypothetical protein